MFVMTWNCFESLTRLHACCSSFVGVVRGIGWQRAGAIANLGAYYAVGLPVALFLGFKCRLNEGVRILNTPQPSNRPISSSYHSELNCADD